MKRCLDLYCCEGGASMGYHRAGYTVYGVDLFETFSRKRYPFPAYTGDVLNVLNTLIAGGSILFDNGEELSLEDFDIITASPPCQHASIATRGIDFSVYPRLIEPTRELLIKTGKPYVIENVRGSDLLDPIQLCGCMFDLTALDEDGEPLRLERRRRFESNMPISIPRECKHDKSVDVAGSYGGSRRQGDTPAERRYNAKHLRKGGYVPAGAIQKALLGIDWMTQRGMWQSIPPVYTEHIGKQLLEMRTNA